MKDEAQELFGKLSNFGIAHQDIPQDVLEAMDYVANYCGDIAHGREYKPEELPTAMPTILAIAHQQTAEENTVLRHVVNYYLGDDYMAEHPDPKEWRAEAVRRSTEDGKEYFLEVRNQTLDGLHNRLPAKDTWGAKSTSGIDDEKPFNDGFNLAVDKVAQIIQEMKDGNAS